MINRILNKRMNQVPKSDKFEMTLEKGDKIILSDGMIIILGTQLNICSNGDKHIYWGNDRKRYIAEVFRPIVYNGVFHDNKNTLYYSIDREKKETLLDFIEKDYLKQVLSPFKSYESSIYIVKQDVYIDDQTEQMEQILIKYKDAKMQFPPFKKGRMYMNLETNVLYTAEELCIFD